MADLAISFHWTPAEMAEFSLAELMHWRELARERMPPDDK